MKTYDLEDAQSKLAETPAKLGAVIAMSLLRANNTAIYAGAAADKAARRIPEKWYAAAVVAIIAIIMLKASQ